MSKIYKTLGDLIDSLCTTDIKCYMFQEMQNKATSIEDKAFYADRVMEMNRKRNILMRGIDSLMGFEDTTVTPKTYLEDKKEDLESEF